METSQKMDKLLSRPVAYAIGVYLTLLVVFKILQSNLLPFAHSLSLSQAQIFCFPLVVFVLFYFRSRFIKIPGILFLAIVLCGSLASWANYSVFTNGEFAFHIARFTDDDFETQSRIFRERINSSFPWGEPVRAYRYWDSINSREQAQKVIAENKDINIVIWGNTKGVRASFGQVASTTPADMLDLRSSNPLLSLELFETVPELGLPGSPEGAAEKFIASLFLGMLHVNNKSQKVSGGMGMRHEHDLMYAAQFPAAFRFSEHRAFAYWQLGNQYLKKGLNDPQSRKGFWQCSQDAYSLAASYVLRQVNPELFAAIHNNYAVLLLLRRFLGNARIRLKSIRKSFLYASSAIAFPGNYQAQKESYSPLLKNMLLFNRLKTPGFEKKGSISKSQKLNQKLKKKRKKRKQNIKRKKQNER